MPSRRVPRPGGRTTAITRVAIRPSRLVARRRALGPGRPPDDHSPAARSGRAHPSRLPPGQTSCGSGRTLTGIVDWVNACVGPAEVDAAHLRVNLAVLEDVAHADRVVAGDPAWDIEAAFGFLDWGSRDAVEAWPSPWPELGAATARSRLEVFVARALAQLG